MRNLPYRWFRNIATLQEKRDYSVTVILLFSIFVGAGRLLGEWILAGFGVHTVLLDTLLFTTFYWYCFFTYALVLKLLVRQPWRRSINVILIGIFCGLLPPVLDAVFSGIGHFHYSYLMTDISGWSPWIYNPEAGFPIGEAVALWLTIIFTALYVHLRTGSLPKAALGLVLAYAVVVYHARVVIHGVELFNQFADWPAGHRMVLLPVAQLATALAVYLFFQPALARGLAGRILHAFPFVLMSLTGSAFMGWVGVESYFYAGVLLFIFTVALAQNDFYDREEDSLQARPQYLDREDLGFLNITALMLVAILLTASTLVGVLLALILVVSFLYSYPYYRGKMFFPANLKMEGVWGAASFLVGVTSFLEHQAYGQPRWTFGALGEESAGLPNAFSLSGAMPLLLVFGGYSIVSALKDYKDWEADAAVGVQTFYTLAVKRGFAPERVHRALTAASAACLFAPFPLLVSAGRLGSMHLLIGLGFVAALLANARAFTSKQEFDHVLALLSIYFVYFLAVL